jgi:MFS family permease
VEARILSLRRADASWVSVMVTFAAATAIESLAGSQMGAFTPLYLGGLGVHGTDVARWTAAMASLGWVAGIPLAPLWGALADRYSYKAVIVRSSVLQALMLMGWILAPNAAVALAFRTLSGFAVGNAGVMIALQTWMTARRRLGLAIGVIGAGGSIGMAAGPALGALLIRLGGLHLMLGVDALLALAIAGLIVLAVPEPERARATEVHPLRQAGRSLRHVAAEPAVRILFLTSFLGIAAASLVRPLVPIFIGHLAGASTTVVIGAVLSVAGGIAALAGPLWGWLIDRVGPLRVLAGTASVGAGALVMAGILVRTPAFYGCVIASAAVAGAAQITTASMLARIVPEDRRASILGLIYLPFYVAQVLLPPIGAALFQLGPVPLYATAAAILLMQPLALSRLRLEPAAPDARLDAAG